MTSASRRYCRSYAELDARSLSGDLPISYAVTAFDCPIYVGHGMGAAITFALSIAVNPLHDNEQLGGQHLHAVAIVFNIGSSIPALSVNR